MAKRKFKKGDKTNKGVFKSYAADGVTCSTEEIVDSGRTRIHISRESELYLENEEVKSSKGKYSNVNIKRNPKDKIH